MSIYVGFGDIKEWLGTIMSCTVTWVALWDSFFRFVFGHSTDWCRLKAISTYEIWISIQHKRIVNPASRAIVPNHKNCWSDAMWWATSSGKRSFWKFLINFAFEADPNRSWRTAQPAHQNQNRSRENLYDPFHVVSKQSKSVRSSIVLPSTAGLLFKSKLLLKFCCLFTNKGDMRLP